MIDLSWLAIILTITILGYFLIDLLHDILNVLKLILIELKENKND